MKSTPDIRTLKIEADGDLWKGLIKPKIRLTGHWLERAGFKPGERVQVHCVAPGVIELRSSVPPALPPELAEPLPSVVNLVPGVAVRLVNPLQTMKQKPPRRWSQPTHATLCAVVAKVEPPRRAELRLLGKDGWNPVGQITIPVHEPLPPVGEVVEIRYRSADPKTRQLEQPLYLRRRPDVDVTDCALRQLQFPATSPT